MRITEHKDVQVAKVNARQAVLVALISATAGVVATLFGTGALSHTPGASVARQHYFTIRRVETADAKLKGIRIIAEINGRAVSYPTRAVWMDIKPATEGETFSIESSDAYRVRMEMLAVNAAGEVSRYISSMIQDIQTNQLPIDQTYEVHLLGSETSGSGPIVGRIWYTLSDQPR